MADIVDQVDDFAALEKAYLEVTLGTFAPNAGLRGVDYFLQKLITAYPWLECGKCLYVWPVGSNHDAKYDRQCPNCEATPVSRVMTFDAERMMYADDWLTAKVLAVLKGRMPHAREDASTDREPETARLPARGRSAGRDLGVESPGHGGRDAEAEAADALASPFE